MTASNVNVDRGGYDYEFVDPPSDMFLCKICHLPSKEPRLSRCCGHTFCNSCLDGLRLAHSSFLTNVACPMCRADQDFNTVHNKQNERAIKNLHVFCTNKNKGCVWQGEVNAITSHLKNSNGCQFEEVKCSNDCGLLLQRQHLPSHVDNECPCREVQCQYCNMVGQYCQFIEGQHIEKCPKVLLSCPNSCGVDSILRKNMEEHKATCPLEEIECPEYCGMVLQRQFITNHVETECPCRIVGCQYCQLSGEYQVIEGQHKEECPKLPIHCPNECKTGNILREDMEDHRQKCPLEVIKCEYFNMGCHITMARKDQHMHEKEKMEEHLLLTKKELINIKSNYNANNAKMNRLESEIQQNHSKINRLESEVHQNHSMIKIILILVVVLIFIVIIIIPVVYSLYSQLAQQQEHLNNISESSWW